MPDKPNIQAESKQGFLRLDAPPSDKSPLSVWSVFRSRSLPAVIYGKVIPESEIQRSKYEEKFVNWLAKLREPAEKAAAAAAAVAEQVLSPLPSKSRVTFVSLRWDQIFLLKRESNRRA